MNAAKTLRWAASLLVLLMLACLGLRFWLYLDLGYHALLWPYERDYGEGIVWQQANLMFTPEAYGRIDGFPAIIFHYPPLYHVTTRALAAFSGGDMLFAGRLVSILSTVLSAIMIGVLSARTLPAPAVTWGKWIAGITAALVPFSMSPIICWGLLMRVDMLALAFSMTGFWVGLKAFERPRLIYAASLLFVLAIFTKQTSIAAPAALFSLMLWLSPRLALQGIATCIVLGLVALGGLEWATHGGFVHHIIGYNINRMVWKYLIGIIFIVNEQRFFFLVVVFSLVSRLATLRNKWVGQPAQAILVDKADTSFIAVFFYFITSSAMLITVAKSGASINYYIEWLCVIAILVGHALSDAIRTITSNKDHRIQIPAQWLQTTGIPLAIAAQLLFFAPLYYNQEPSPLRLKELKSLSAQIRMANKPIISDDMVILLKNGKPVVWEPAIFAELASKGVWDERSFVRRIYNHEFAMFITDNVRGNPIFDSRYNPAVADAMDKAYPVIKKQAGYVLHLPAKDNK